MLRRLRDEDGKPIGRVNVNPILDIGLYELRFSDGAILEYSPNVITEKIYSKIENHGNQQVELDMIAGHRKTVDSLHVSENPNMKKTTKDWEIGVQWKNG